MRAQTNDVKCKTDRLVNDSSSTYFGARMYFACGDLYRYLRLKLINLVTGFKWEKFNENTRCEKFRSWGLG